MQLHNVNLILLSSYMSSSAVYNAYKYGYKLWGTGYSPAEIDMGHTVYIFYVSKLYEFLDTVSQCLRHSTCLISPPVPHCHGTAKSTRKSPHGCMHACLM